MRHVGNINPRGAYVKIVVIGGTGLIGSRLVEKLRDVGHELVSASPDTGVDTYTGKGLQEALDGAQVVVDVSNAPAWDDAAVLDFFETTAHNVLDVETSAGVTHHVLLSVAGVDRLKDSGYMRAKLVQEETVNSYAVPYTILRATQFFEFIGRIAESSVIGDAVHLPPVLIQPEAADDVAAALADVSLGEPLNGIVELGGPEQFRLDEIAGRVLRAKNDPRRVIADPEARYFGA
ncbi:MAG TPA: SDR family oxidoreductase, partial [Candidatus Binatia bacterium]|nr:SDR family oxidoreductase [Candidatus Binatia bacterium]